MAFFYIIPDLITEDNKFAKFSASEIDKYRDYLFKNLIMNFHISVIF